MPAPIKRRDLTKKYTISYKTADGRVHFPHSPELKFKKTVDVAGKEIPKERRKYRPSAAGKLNSALSVTGTAEELFAKKMSGINARRSNQKKKKKKKKISGSR
jgi:hypothetical protein